MNSIVIIIPWYGEIPNYFPFFLKGLDFNSDVVDVLFVTDVPIQNKVPSNFKIKPLAWEELNKRIKEVIGKEANIKNPYKLCDFKPMFGKIFEKEIEDYKYWGYGDIDLIYGDLKRFLPFDGIENYDVITFRENVMHGPFSLFKNNSYTRNLYSKTNKLLDIITNPNCIGFDEAARRKPWRNGIRLYNLIELDNFWDWSSIVQYEADQGKLRLFERNYCLEYIHSNCILNFNKGKLTIGMDEYAFFHWVCHKKLNNFYIPQWNIIPDSFFIHRTGFYKCSNPLFPIKKVIREWRGKIVSFSKRIKDSYNYRIRNRKS
jgi:hypothetical protein